LGHVGFAGNATRRKGRTRNWLETNSFDFGEALPTVSHGDEYRTTTYDEHQ